MMRISLNNATHNKVPDQIPVVRYDVANTAGVFEARYWSAGFKPVLDQDGEVLYIIQYANEVTEQIKAEKEQRALREIEKNYNMFMQAPIAVCIVTGPENIIELANEENLRILGRTSDIIGKPFFKAIPEAKEQGFAALLDQVRKSGQPFHATEQPVIGLVQPMGEAKPSIRAELCWFKLFLFVFNNHRNVISYELTLRSNSFYFLYFYTSCCILHKE